MHNQAFESDSLKLAAQLNVEAVEKVKYNEITESYEYN